LTQGWNVKRTGILTALIGWEI
jgi:hypothetical protein